MRSFAQATGLFPLPTVLVVDPDPDTLELYSVMLSGVAHDIQHADDGRIALAKVLAHPPSLLVTDTHVPFIDGYALCQLLRSDPATATMPIVIATSDGTPASVQRARAAGANAVLVKPFFAEPLIATVRDVMETQSDFPSRFAAAKRDASPRNAALQPFDPAESRTKSHAHERYATTAPPRVPPPLRCPTCDRPLDYLRSHIGGVNAAYPEQWDHFECAQGCGAFDYRHRTRKLSRKP